MGHEADVIGDKWKLTPDDVTRTTAILALRRVGKTYTASVIAEEMYDLGVPWVALDPTGAWFGMRSNATGKGSGLPVVILGGAHGDVPLEETAGKFVAELVIDEPGWYVIDFSLFESLSAERRFATDFAERLYRRKLRAETKTAMHLFVDEADRFVPQRPPQGDQRMLGAFEALVRRGGVTGIGTTLISQRAAVVNKNVLEQIDQLVMLRTTGPNDRNAVDEYLSATATKEQRAEWKATIASLPTGTAWRWEPHGDIFEQVKIRTRRTFNSSATPKAGVVQVVPSVFAKIDLGAVKERMAATIERAKADDPKLLRAEVAKLRKELAQQQRAVEPERVEVPVEVVPPGIVDALRGTLTAYDELLEGFGRARRHLADRLDEVEKQRSVSRPAGNGDKRRASAGPAPTAAQPAPARTPPEYGTKGAFAATLDGPLPKMERKILAVLAQHPDGRTNTQLTTLTGYRYSGGFKNALSALRTAGLIVGGNTATMRITDAGLALDDWDPLPTGPALLDWWNENQLSGMERPMLEYLLKIHPESITGEELAVATDYAYSGGFKNALSKLRTLAIIEGGNTTGVRATDDFVEAVS